MSSSMDRLRSRLNGQDSPSAAPGFWDSIKGGGGTVKQIPTDRLHTYARHTFRLRDTDEFLSLIHI